MRVHGVPEETVAVCGYPSLKAAVATVPQIIQLALPIARAELMDEPAMPACVDYFKLDYEYGLPCFSNSLARPKLLPNR
ncbi:FAD-linked oxidase C-terminal domain-containing protein [Mesorhizobium sp. M4B.F.Ca.ET.049.02.1.2]|uniref:FAD-linked oxidase C-terminal domain-containing protein n=1 Tax=unclassified Mesorhizobium TaxID=325217 RepID=UPI0032B00F0D